MTAALWAGVARVDITPPVGLTWQGGYAGRQQPAQGVHDPLSATALVLGNTADVPASRVALVSIDLLNLSTDQVATIRQRIGELGTVPPESVMFLCSHTHGGPATLPRAHPPLNSSYLGLLMQQLAGVVHAAAQSLQPVRLRLGQTSTGFNVNRRLRTPDGSTAMRPNPSGAVDHSVSVVRLERDETATAAVAPLALLFRYACHPTAMGGQNHLITADYPGAARRYVEKAYTEEGGTRAMFLPGCFANLRPNLQGPGGGFRSASWPELASLGRQLAGAVMSAAEVAIDPTAGEPLDLTGAAGSASAQAALPLQANGAGKESWPADVQVIRLGGLYLVGLPGEVFVETGWLTQAAVAAVAAVPRTQVLVQGYANGTIDYVPTAAALAEGGYEVDAWQRGPRPAGFSEEVEAVLADTAAALAARLAGPA